MPSTSIFLHVSVRDYLDELTAILELSRSEVVETMIRYFKNEIDEEEVFEGYDDAKKEWIEAQEEAEAEAEKEADLEEMEAQSEEALPKEEGED